jgi:hypothetical protein
MSKRHTVFVTADKNNKRNLKESCRGVRKLMFFTFSFRLQHISEEALLRRKEQ